LCILNNPIKVFRIGTEGPMKSVASVAGIKRCHVSTVRNAVKEGSLSGRMFAGVWLILEDEKLRNWVPRPHGRPRKTPAVKEPVGVMAV